MPVVTLTREGPVAVVVVDDGKANALRASLLQELSDALDLVERSDAAALVIAGRPGFYSGGLDLKLLPTLSTVEKNETFHLFGRLMVRVFGSPIPTVAAMTGHAIAGGALLALACDVRVAAAEGGRFGLTEVPLGLPLPTFGLALARAAVPAHLLTEVCLHGRVYGLAEAAERGIVEAVVPADRVVEAAIGRAVELAKVPAEAYAVTKDRLRGESIREALARMDGEVAGFIRIFEARMAPRASG